MREIINSIFTESSFRAVARLQDCIFFENPLEGQNSYFLVVYLETSNLKGYLDSEYFEQVQSFFEEQKKNKADIDKNTSLLIIAKANELEQDFLANKNSILEIEEDEFWFKKYVLIYSDTSVEGFGHGQEVLSELKACVLNSTRFTEFKDSLFLDAEYFVVMQIFLKFPFLNVPISLNEQFLSIDNILQNNLSESQISFLDLLVGEVDAFEEDYWERLKDASVKAVESEELKTFFTKFEADDKNS